MTISHKRVWSLFAITCIFALIFALSGCGSQQSESPKQDAQKQETEQKETPVAEKKEGDKIVINDVMGRKVELDAYPQKVALSESRTAFVTLFLNKENPVEHVVAWGKDLQKNAPDVYSRLLKIAPDAEKIPVIGSFKKGDLTVEELVKYSPDMFILGKDAYEAAKKSSLLDQLESAHIPYVVTDFRDDPLKNTEISVRAIGQVFNKEENAEKFISFWHSKVDPLVEKGKTIDAKKGPKTFLWRAAGLSDPFRTYGTENFGMMLNTVGANNIGLEVLNNGGHGTITPEQLLSANPQVIIATGGQWQKHKRDDGSPSMSALVGYDTSKEEAEKTLAGLGSEAGVDQTDAFKNKDVHVIYHQFYDSPYNFAAFETFAKWANPDEFKDLDPDATWKEFHDKFMPFPVEGVFWASLN